MHPVSRGIVGNVVPVLRFAVGDYRPNSGLVLCPVGCRRCYCVRKSRPRHCVRENFSPGLGSWLPPGPILGERCLSSGLSQSVVMSGAGSVPEDVVTDDCLLNYSYIFSSDILKDKVAFITGGGSGIGFRIAEILMRHGCQTVIASRSLERVQASAAKLRAATGQRCLPASVDVRKPETIIAAVEAALQEFEKVDILVNYAMTRHLAVEWGPDNIRVNSLAPGPIAGTEGFRKLGGLARLASDQWKLIPLQRVGTKTEIAHGVLYLVSSAASYVTGASLVIDGGHWLTGANNMSAMLSLLPTSAKL
ncbi:peroxisomal 2,4-dienoyl-CoA reductase [(3E)-enoyl-CoA-producing] isoform X2 [Mobula hypostoma]|uniref:peroxisomal 2,4-dienoyl-CoA reductase [(3E)-enoyl-CoA-producing] isoform X2 n=1 Tax=Mobula hypostoma TaxID=723540 RepID=UPI002FC32DA6